ncbi:hypothetical protein OH76DRAFT_703157 [Lentinus brumalis]|uniref:Uncharacterized protein n=1 Tax=Lentinus brumalis TaxID=2498619 RepID=A0A371D5P5_9APHY|nr:hypothetical protein OH76DRAFT_703157 [Polyporus brumalis]
MIRPSRNAVLLQLKLSRINIAIACMGWFRAAANDWNVEWKRDTYSAANTGYAAGICMPPCNRLLQRRLTCPLPCLTFGNELRKCAERSRLPRSLRSTPRHTRHQGCRKYPGRSTEWIGMLVIIGLAQPLSSSLVRRVSWTTTSTRQTSNILRLLVHYSGRILRGLMRIMHTLVFACTTGM